MPPPTARCATNRWYLDHLIYKDFKVYPPCESNLGDLQNTDFVITKSSDNSIEFDHGISGNAANNGFSGSFKISNDTIIFSSFGWGITTSVGTKSEVDFEGKYFEGIFPNLKLTFNISNNLLQLNNFDNNIIYNLYTQ